MSYAYQICPDCYGMIKEEMAEEMKQNRGRGGNPIALGAVKAVEPVANFANKLTDVANQAAERREAKREKIGWYDEKKKKKAVRYFNKLKRQRKFGKLPPNLNTDEELWDYAIQASGLL